MTTDPPGPQRESTTRLPAVRAEDGNVGRIADVVLTLVGNVPDTGRHVESDPRRVAHEIARQAASRAAVTAGSLAMPPGPVGWFTIFPELVAVWRIQAQMVADVAGVYGRTATLSREHMLFCLFRHTAAQALRDVCVRVGERWLIRRASVRALQRVAQAIGVRATQRSIGRGISRWLPVVGAVGVGAYAFYDTGRVAATAIELFEQELIVNPDA